MQKQVGKIEKKVHDCDIPDGQYETSQVVLTDSIVYNLGKLLNIYITHKKTCWVANCAL